MVPKILLLIKYAATTRVFFRVVEKAFMCACVEKKKGGRIHPRNAEETKTEKWTLFGWQLVSVLIQRITIAHYHIVVYINDIRVRSFDIIILLLLLEKFFIVGESVKITPTIYSYSY